MGGHIKGTKDNKHFQIQNKIKIESFIESKGVFKITMSPYD